MATIVLQGIADEGKYPSADDMRHSAPPIDADQYYHFVQKTAVTAGSGVTSAVICDLYVHKSITTTTADTHTITFQGA